MLAAAVVCTVLPLVGCASSGRALASQASVEKVTTAAVPPLVIAHRGASGYLPEHTLGGYELAVRQGADYIEPDLQFTRDRQLVAMHDATLTRTTDVLSVFPGRASYEVSAFTLAEIRRLTVLPTGRTARAGYAGFVPSSSEPWRVPTFQDVIDLAKRLDGGTRRIGLYPEAKQADPAMEDAILAALTASGLRGSDPVFIQSFSVDTIRSLHDKQQRLGTDFGLVLLANSADTLVMLGLGRIASFATGIGVSINGPGLDEAFVREAHTVGLLVHGYTFNKTGPAATAEYRHYFDLGLDGVFSNYPDLAVTARDAVGTLKR